MYQFLLIIISVVCLFIIRISKRGFANISGIFVIAWSVCLFFASLSLYGMNSLSEDVKMLCLIPLPIFAIAACLFPIDSISEDQPKDHYVSTRSYASNKLLLFFNSLIYAISIPYLIKVIGFIGKGNIYWLRSASFEGSSIYMSTAQLTIYGTIFRPLLICMIILTAIDYSRHCGKWICLVFSICNVILYSVLFVGRYMVFEALVIMLASFYTRQKTNILKFIHDHKRVIVFGLIGLGLMVYITDSRTNNSLSRSVYAYFCGSFGFLNTLVERHIGLDLHLHGRAQWGFIYNLLYLVLSIIGFVPRQGSSSYQITQLTGDTMSIGKGMSYNSLGTFLHTFIADYGKWGCIFGVLLFAVILNAIEKKRFVKNNTFLTAIYIELIFVATNCILQYSLLSSSMGMLFIYIYLFTHRFHFKGGKLIISD